MAGYGLLPKTQQTSHRKVILDIALRRGGGGTVGARDGIRTRDPNLTKIVRYRCATRALQTRMRLFQVIQGGRS